MFQSFEINRLTNTAPGADLLTLVKSNFWAQSGRNMSNFGGKSRWGWREQRYLRRVSHQRCIIHLFPSWLRYSFQASRLQSRLHSPIDLRDWVLNKSFRFQRHLSNYIFLKVHLAAAQLTIKRNQVDSIVNYDDKGWLICTTSWINSIDKLTNRLFKVNLTAESSWLVRRRTAAIAASNFGRLQTSLPLLWMGFFLSTFCETLLWQDCQDSPCAIDRHKYDQRIQYWPVNQSKNSNCTWIYRILVWFVAYLAEIASCTAFVTLQTRCISTTAHVFCIELHSFGCDSRAGRFVFAGGFHFYTEGRQLISFLFLLASHELNLATAFSLSARRQLKKIPRNIVTATLDQITQRRPISSDQ